MTDVSHSIPTPLTTRACADFMGFTPEWIRCAIDAGVTVDGRRVQLAAETLTIGSRRTHRIHVDQFVRFLDAIGWKRMPAILPTAHS
jgi:hypothetical protein